jgi:hypothetical protein
MSTAGWVRTPDGACGVLKPEAPESFLLPAYRFLNDTREKFTLKLSGVEVSSPATGSVP